MTPTARVLEGGAMLRVGDPAPEFDLETDTGERVTLASFRGTPTILYFYPKDDTPGCTRQACSIRDSWAEFGRIGANVIGVSPQSPESHRKFKAKYGLPFPLLADTEHTMAEDYGVWVEKKNYGKTYMGIERSTFVIDADGNLAAIKRRVKPDEHTAWALSEVEKLTAGATS
jgi:thioredoxin-dependent peroxiredoxin